MKAITHTTSGLIILSLFLSCQKTELPIPKNLAMDIESCKPNKKDLYIGKEYQGGVIFYLDETGKNGLIVAKEDIGVAPWGCIGQTIPEARKIDIGDGKSNSKAILKNCDEPGIGARLCAKYVVREKDKKGRKYDDWYLPSLNEVIEIANKISGPFSLKCNTTYLSSSESLGGWQGTPLDPTQYTYQIRNMCGYVILNPNTWKSTNIAVRPIRSF